MTDWSVIHIQDTQFRALCQGKTSTRIHSIHSFSHSVGEMSNLIFKDTSGGYAAGYVTGPVSRNEENGLLY